MKSSLFATTTYFFVASIFFGMCLVIQWPGILMHDSFILIDFARRGVVNGWASQIYIEKIKFLLGIWDNPAVLGIFQVSFVVLFSTWFFYMLWKRSESKLAILFGFAAYLVTPINSLMNVFYTRDTIFSWLHCILAFSFAMLFLDLVYSGRRGSLRFALYVIWILFLTILTSSFRQDSFVLLFVVPVLFVFFMLKLRSQFPSRSWKIYGAIFIIYLLMIFTVRPIWLGPPSTYYHISAMINPLSYMVRHNYVTKDRNEDMDVLGRYLKLDIFLNEYDDYEIPAFHKGAVLQDLEAHNMSPFYELYFRMISDNLGMFFQNRWIVWSGIMGGHSKTFYFHDGLAAHLKAQPFPELKVLSERIWWYSFYRPVIGTQWWALWLLSSVILLFWWFPISAAASLIIWSRLPIVFLAAPAAHFKYTYDMFLFAFFLVPLVALEYQKRSTQKL